MGTQDTKLEVGTGVETTKLYTLACSAFFHTALPQPHVLLADFYSSCLNQVGATLFFLMPLTGTPHHCVHPWAQNTSLLTGL